jgi:hypothetical protein
MVSSSQSGEGFGAPKGRTKACTACRQVKLKCNAKDVYPAPCARCVAQKLDCRMDPTFKRVPARKQLEEVTNRLMKLQRSLGLDEDLKLSSKVTPKNQHPTPESLPTRRIEYNIPSKASGFSGSDYDPSSPFDNKFLEISDEPAEGNWTLGTVTLNYPQVLQLFQHFDKVLWRHVPFVEPCNSLHRLYQNNDLLFWTIVYVSARLNNEFNQLCVPLIQHHRMLLASRVFGGAVKNNLETIHAMLILCTWPYVVESQYEDSTWVLSGIAVSVAMSIGLHKPEHGHEYGAKYEKDLIGIPYSRNMTWMACFQINTR